MKKYLLLIIGLIFSISLIAQDVVYLRTNTYGNYWGRNGNTIALNNTFGSGNWTRENFETVNVTQLLASNVKFIFIDGSNMGTCEMITFLNLYRSQLESWVSTGGALFLNAAPNDCRGSFLLAAGISLNWGPSSYGYPITTTHAVFTGPKTPALASYYRGSAFSHSYLSGSGMTGILRDQNSRIILAEKNHGSGKIMYGGLTLEFIGTTTSWFPQTNLSNLYSNILRYTYNNASSCQAPVITCPSNISVNNDANQCGAVVTFNATATGNPAPTISYSPASGSLFSVGTTTVTATATNSCGSASCTFTVTVVDNEAPTISCVTNQPKNTDVGKCDYTTVGTEFDPTTYGDNCPGSTASNNYNSTATLANAIFPKGTTTVVWTVTDASSNTTSCSFDVVVTDNEVPSVITQNITLNLDASGNGSLTTAQINNGSTDNCGIASFALNKYTFNCNDINTALKFDGTNDYASVNNNVIPASGDFTVTVWAKHNSLQTNYREILSQLGPNNFYIGRSYTGELRVGDAWQFTGIAFPSDDKWHHYAVVKTSTNTHLYIDGVLKASRGAAMANPTGADFRIARQYGSHLENFDGHIDEITVWNSAKTALEIAGFMSTPPLGSESDLMAFYNMEGMSGDNILTDVSGNGNDCHFVNMDANTVWQLRENLITLTATDDNGNFASANAFVSVIDNIAPTVLTQNITIQLDGSGNTGIIPAQVDNGSNDACGIGNMSVNPNSFSCSDVGVNTVTLSVTDKHGNTATNTAVITVEDNIIPAVLTQDITVQLDASGNAAITPAQIDIGSNDACGIASMNVTPTTFNCSDIGAGASQNYSVDINSPRAHINAGSSATLKMTSQMTMEAWVYPTSNSGTYGGIIFNKEGEYEMARFSDGYLYWAFANTNPGWTWKNSGIYLPYNNWTHIAITYNNGMVKAYQNGSLISTYSGSGSIGDISPLLNELWMGERSGLSQYYIGRIDEARIWNVERSSAELASNYNITITGSESGLVGYWPMEDGPGSSISSDYTANNLDGTLVGLNVNTVWVGSSPAQAAANVVTLTVTDVNGNTATNTALVTVEDNIVPTVLIQNITIQLDGSGNAGIIPAQVDNGSNDACGIASFSVSPNSFNCSDVGVNTVTLSVTDNNGNTATNTAVVTVEDKVLPNAIAQSVSIQLDASGNASITAIDINNGSTDACGIASFALSKYNFDCINVGANTVTLTVTDNNGNVSTATATVTVEDNVIPIALTKDITVQLDASGEANIIAADVDFGSNDACGIASLAVFPNNFKCLNVGINTVTLTVTDNNGNISSATAKVTVEDNVDPVVITQDITIQLDASGSASIIPMDIDNGSSDACGINSYSLDVSTFDCNDVGSGGSSYLEFNNSYSYTNISSATLPETNFTLEYWFKTTSASAALFEVNYNGHDRNMYLSNGRFYARLWSNQTIASNVSGLNDGNWHQVSWTVQSGVGQKLYIDGNLVASGSKGESNFYWAARFYLGYSVYGSTNTGGMDEFRLWSKVLTTSEMATYRNQALIGTESGLLVYYDFENTGAGSYADKASLGGANNITYGASTTISSSGSPIGGGQLVTLTVTDVNGNSASQTANVTVEDNVIPTVLTQNITVQLDANGSAAITPQDIDDGSSDNCGIASMTLDNSTFDCSDVGSGNSGVISATMTADNEFWIYLSTDDNLQGLQFGSNAYWPGATTHTTNLVAGQSYYLHVYGKDWGGPEMLLGDLSVTGDFKFANGTQSLSTNVTDWKVSSTGWSAYTVPTDLGANGSYPWGNINSISSSARYIWGTANIAYFTTKVIYTGSSGNEIVLTVTDNNGNSNSATANVKVEDNINPTVLTQNLTIQLDASGVASITTTQIDDGSYDNCGISSFSLDQTGFACSNVGDNTVTLTVTDVNGNVSTGIATVTVEDNVLPIAIAQSITLQLDASGNASITTDDIDNGSSDVCGIASSALSKYDFDCINVGANTVTLTVTDNNGNIKTATSTVTVEDNVAPVALTKDITVQLDASGNVSIIASQVDNSSSDACGIASMTVSPSAFSCANVGTNTVTLTVTDVNGNVSTETAIVTVEDNEVPIALAKDITIQLDASGNAGIVSADVNNGSSDACGIASMTVSPNTFTCSEEGANTVTLTVTDVNNNTSTITATVTVEDNIPASVITQNITIELDASGNASITTGDIDNGSNDACGIASSALNKYDFDCINVGTNTVTLTVTDNNGNVSSNTAIVTVEDNVLPIALTQDITVQLDVSGNVSITASQVDNSSSDACGIASMTVSPSAFSCANVGTNTVTLTVTDVNSNISTETAIVTVEDNVAPVALTKNITIDLDATGNVSITPLDVDDGSNDACGIASLSVAPNTFGCGNTGTNTVTLTVTDNHGNVSTETAVVNVEDNIYPTLTCVEDLDRCANIPFVNTYMTVGTEFDLTSYADNCSVVSVTNNITGTSTLSGYVFATGTTTVTWTVVDPSGNTTTCSFILTVNPLPVASLSSTGANEWCNGVILTASSSTSEGSYEWSTTEVTQDIVLSLNTSTAGTYTVYVTDQNGCTSPLAASYDYEPELLASTYTIIGAKEVKLGERDEVLNGSIGLTDKKGHAKLGKYTKVSGVGSFVKAEKISIHKTSVATTIKAQAVVTLPSMKYYNPAIGSYSNVKVKKNTTQTISTNYVSVKVEEGATAILQGTVFGRIEVKAGGTVVFTSALIDIEELKVHSYGKKHGAYAFVNFSGDAQVRVKKKVEIEGKAMVNSYGHHVIFYIGYIHQSKGKSHHHHGELKIKKSHSSVYFTASAYVPGGEIEVQGSHKKSETTYMTGFFIAEKIKSNGKYVIWNWHDCYQNSSPPSPRIAEEPTFNEEEGEMNLKVYPNPFTSMANIEFSVAESGRAKVDVYNMLGKKVASLFDGEVVEGNTYTSIFQSEQLSNGVYLIRLTTGTESLVERIILAD